MLYKAVSMGCIIYLTYVRLAFLEHELINRMEKMSERTKLHSPCVDHPPDTQSEGGRAEVVG